MDATLFLKMLSDSNITDLKKMQYKYSKEQVSEFVSLLKENIYEKLMIKDFKGENIVYLKNAVNVKPMPLKMLSRPQNNNYGIEAMEKEIYSTLEIESIDSSRESIRKIFKGYAPDGQQENRIYSMKKGLEFICSKENKITEENIHRLYNIVIADFLDEDNKLKDGSFYRHDTVYIVGEEIEHTGIAFEKIPEYMKTLVDFINSDDDMDEILKAAAIHFYVAYLHPYFDGNGRMARLIHLWYLVQKNYSSAMFVSFSYLISKSKVKYYNAYRAVENNALISGVIDITPFLKYFNENIYNKLETESINSIDLINVFNESLKNGQITEKEKELWNFVISVYGEREFSTKMLEKDFGNLCICNHKGICS